jgi:surface polysaccharide O-acyltransferase-like enzyme
VESTLVKIACRVAVPFFFITSGYFMKTGSKLDIEIVLKPLRRLLPIYFSDSLFIIFSSVWRLSSLGTSASTTCSRAVLPTIYGSCPLWGLDWYS